MDELIEKFEALLSPSLGEDTVVDEAEELGPNGIAFYNEEPNPEFNGFSGEVMLEVNLLLDEEDDDKVRRIERVGDAVIFTKFTSQQFRRSAANKGTYHAEGMALVCGKASEEEHRFLELVMSEIMDEATEPLRAVIDFAREVSIKLPDANTNALSSLLRNT